jgi:hypothetical protein
VSFALAPGSWTVINGWSHALFYIQYFVLAPKATVTREKEKLDQIVGG